MQSVGCCLSFPSRFFFFGIELSFVDVNDHLVRRIGRIGRISRISVNRTIGRVRDRRRWRAAAASATRDGVTQLVEEGRRFTLVTVVGRVRALLDQIVLVFTQLQCQNRNWNLSELWSNWNFLNQPVIHN